MMEIKCYTSTLIALHFISFQPEGRLVQGRFAEGRFGQRPIWPKADLSNSLGKILDRTECLTKTKKKLGILLFLDFEKTFEQ